MATLNVSLTLLDVIVALILQLLILYLVLLRFHLRIFGKNTKNSIGNFGLNWV